MGGAGDGDGGDYAGDVVDLGRRRGVAAMEDWRKEGDDVIRFHILIGLFVFLFLILK